MTSRIDPSDPAVERLAHTQVDEALRSRGIDLEDPVRGELVSRVDPSFGYRGTAGDPLS